MIVFPLIRSVRLKAATASSRQPPCACVPFISLEFHCKHRANFLGQRNTELRSGPVSEPVVHATDLVANLEVRDSVPDAFMYVRSFLFSSSLGFSRHHGDESTWRHDRRLAVLSSV
jgi:hypothetical protein